MKVVIADDHPVVLVGMKAMLHQDGRWRVVGEAGSGRELLGRLGGCECDLVITDFSMPREGSEDGLLLLRRLQRLRPGLPVIVLTMVHNGALVRGMFAAGAAGVVAKTAMTRELLVACHAVANGRGYLSEPMRKGLEAVPWLDGARSQALSPEAALSSLSPREAEVVRRYVGGQSVSEIARQLSRSVKTVSQQKNDAMRKLGLANHSQLYEFARNVGLSS
ncbi:response regulator transcription factor [Fulvimonas soli]|uniref:response regulator transcription factor n=1 Tax=Fulvimonas soli TaxID=155197 RepID=UPI001FEA68E0|nr:response regulator transcription factor [Fulvimonas soli]